MTEKIDHIEYVGLRVYPNMGFESIKKAYDLLIKKAEEHGLKKFRIFIEFNTVEGVDILLLCLRIPKNGE